MTRPRLFGTLFVVVMSAAFPTPSETDEAPGCVHATNESPDHWTRRQAALRYVRVIKAAQARLNVERGTYVSLVDAEAAGATTAPFGFVPRLTFDQWGFALVLKDVLDSCGFSLFADQDKTIYAAQPLGEDELAEAAPRK